jgi:dihydroneopterin aldolase
MSQPDPVTPLPAARREAEHKTDHKVFVRDLMLTCMIGVHGHERRARQRVRVNLTLDVASSARAAADALAGVVDYETIVDGIRRLADAGHINLVETLAERIADLALADRRVLAATVKVEKIDVFADAASVGVELTRRR